MTQQALVRGEHLAVALSLAAAGVPVLPLRAGKVPFGNCLDCTDNRCGGRPNMKTPGPCTCPAPCHGWAAATTDLAVLNSPEWTRAWQQAAVVAYHPGGAGITVVDLDDEGAIAWAREHLPATRTVRTTRGEHWLYRGTMPSANAVRPGVDVKSLMSYARWLGPGNGPMQPLPDAVGALLVRQPSPGRQRPATAPLGARGGVCPHRSPRFLERGIAMAEQRIAAATTGIHATVFAAFLAVLATHGRCGCLTDAHVARLFAAAGAKGESPRHCAEAWANAVHRLGMNS
ncbi:DNA primase [Kitasatospora phosalacinea]|uniref:DNA primase n=1 Tax=Kitasatospora phosalacinea TaxID=2065 RepID=A0A9W6Q448_9ACTN|nr:bifunctional DNA primase/polymerase [Kitasatospora phosalacinea]GLW68441.1 DNA primase [Kitasatospora phosalacinea]